MQLCLLAAVIFQKENFMFKWVKINWLIGIELFSFTLLQKFNENKPNIFNNS